jgi:cell division protein FtsB
MSRMRGSTIRSPALRREASADRRGSSGRLTAAIVLSVLLFFVGFLYVHQSVQLMELTARVEELSAEVERIEQVNRTLAVRREASLSLEDVAEIAMRDLGMVAPEVVYYVPQPDTTE